jgi:hypothetical protein
MLLLNEETSESWGNGADGFCLQNLSFCLVLHVLLITSVNAVKQTNQPARLPNWKVVTAAKKGVNCLGEQSIAGWLLFEHCA